MGIKGAHSVRGILFEFMTVKNLYNSRFTNRSTQSGRFVFLFIIIFAIVWFFLYSMYRPYFLPANTSAVINVVVPVKTSTYVAPDVVGTVTTNSNAQYVGGPINPNRIAIPSLNIDAMIEDVGVNNKNNIAVPKSFQTVGWYKYSVLPGEKGMSIFDGHLNNALGMDGVFSDLGKIRIGDDIVVSDQKGNKVRFVVTATSSLGYLSKLNSLESLGSSDHSARKIVLITCEGEWVATSKTYTDRLIVVGEIK